jgi:hypothetical protein
VSEDLFPEAIRLGRELGSQSAVAAALRGQAEIAHHEYHDTARARALFTQSLEIERALRHAMGVAYSLHGLVWLALLEGDDQAVWTMGHEAAELYRELGNRTELDNVTFLVAIAALRLGKEGEVLAMIRESRAAARLVRDPRLGVPWLDPLGAVAAARGSPETAARVWGAMDAFREHEGTRWMDPPDHWLFTPIRDAVRAQLDDDVWTAHHEAGCRMSVDDAFAHGLEAVDALETGISSPFSIG